MHSLAVTSIHFASVEDITTVGSNPSFYPTPLPANITLPPPIDLRVIGHVANSGPNSVILVPQGVCRILPVVVPACDVFSGFFDSFCEHNTSNWSLANICGFGCACSKQSNEYYLRVRKDTTLTVPYISTHHHDRYVDLLLLFQRNVLVRMIAMSLFLIALLTDFADFVARLSKTARSSASCRGFSACHCFTGQSRV